MFTETASKLAPPFLSFSPSAPVQDRNFWENLDDSIKQQLIKDGEAYLNYDYPILKAMDYMEFSRNGCRVNYETKLFSRRTALNTLVLAECVENKGRFMDDIINGIFMICEESGWQLPAHNSYIRDTPQFPLPDVTRPVIDLFSAETGAVLAVAEFLLREPLARISPAISKLIDHNLETRIFTPYLSEYFWWMGDGRESLNNWTVWCTQNILLAAFTRTMTVDRQMAVIEKACRSVDYFLGEYGEDGCCDEGAQYYRHAGLCLFNCIEILNGITGNAFSSLYKADKIKNIAAYIVNVHISDIYYVNFSDCSPAAGRCNAREFLFGLRTDNPDLMKLAASDYQKSADPLLTEEHNLFYRLQTLACHKDMMNYEKNPLIHYKDLYYGSTGLFISRDSRYCLAVKGGCNNDSHNHNDTGSFTIYKDGQPLFIDIGVESYTRKTFSPQRYEIWTMQSQFHNLPTFLGCSRSDLEQMPYAYASDFMDGIGAMEMNGEDYKAKNVAYLLDGECSSITMDIADAYPDRRIITYVRKAALYKGKEIVIEDSYTGTLAPVVLSLISYEKPNWNEERRVLSIGELGECRITGCSSVKTEAFAVEDQRLRLAWKHELYRSLVTFEGSELELRIR
ncbi:heparinase [Clostridium sp. chh4-2]|uniref:heparinase II/III domain-containing protein n=1 Tax=Clostridium sp. chh4-2 TaxID=2067550 RepID=UPI000CCF4DBF|nr:heparinase II/III family protein [Clostridium sp. chh4-2]PNV59464.1 heparinase [Clostridium sp. chh4-2]